jgi:hypothetical protein
VAVVGAQDGPEHVHVEQPPPVLEGQRAREVVPPHVQAGVVDEHVHAAEPLDGRRHHVRH